MRLTRQILVISGFMGILGMWMPALAQAQEAMKAPADRTLQGDAVCTKCHDESEEKPILAFYKSHMGNKADERTPGCQSCHGASLGHVKSSKESPDIVFGSKAKAYPISDPQDQAAVCLTCHDDGNRTLWQGSQHQSRDIICTSCHTNHTQDGSDPILKNSTQAEVCYTCHKTQRSESLRISTHPVKAGKVSCSDCHNPHGSEGPKLMKDITVRDTCFTCHAEKRGPFLYEHPSAMDDCMNCHTPHGSTNPPLLKARNPWLCQSCHADGAPHPGNLYSAAGLPGGAVANVNTQNSVLNGTINPVTGQMVTMNAPPNQLAFRGCTNCHTQVHGSNNPLGKRLVR